jgi:hypothetical protein
MKLIILGGIFLIALVTVNGVWADDDIETQSGEISIVNNLVISGTPVSSQIMMQVDWNRTGIGFEDEGDPLLFSLTEKPVKTIRNWSEQHSSFLTQFDLYDVGREVTLSRTLDDGTMTLFLDLDGNGMLSDGTEWLFDQNEDVYQILARPLVDSNQNGWFDYSDNLWPIAMIKDGNEYNFASELGILGFNWSNAKHYENDDIGIGQYSDCLYEGISRYRVCTPVSDEHFRIQAFNQNGIILEGGQFVPTFGGVMGMLGEK